MTDFLQRLLHGKRDGRASGQRDRAYVSEFTNFIDHFLEDHPEVVDDQWVGREIYWDKQVDFVNQKHAEKDSVPEDGYGFAYAAWLRNQKTKPEVNGDKG